ncbi:MAG: PD40 domain-containing protein, partial [Nitrospinae bacterium]|nr:PD40 domain-containing protein [Nitrospinota bacterium]
MPVCRFTFTIFAFAFPIFFLASANPVFGSAQINQPIQVTTHPGEDFASTLSADGKLMIFVSDRSGNLDLWLKRRGQGVQPPDEQLTFHSAEDNSPKLSPKGDRVVFISHRSDPKGDIYIMDVGAGGQPDPEKPAGVRLTQADFPEEDPEWSPDERTIYFTSVDPKSRNRGIFKIDIKSQSKTLVIENAVNPAISP